MLSAPSDLVSRSEYLRLKRLSADTEIMLTVCFHGRCTYPCLHEVPVISLLPVTVEAFCNGISSTTTDLAYNSYHARENCLLLASAA